MTKEIDWEPEFDFKHFNPDNVNPNRPWLKYWPENVPKSIKFDPITVQEFVRKTAQQLPNNVAIYYVPANRKYTYREVFWHADKVANALHGLGVRKDSVAIMTGNRPEFIFSMLGILQCGASVSPINPLLRERDVIHILKEAGNINTVFVHRDNYRTIKKARKSVELENIILLGAKEAKDDAITFKEFIQDAPPKPPQVKIDPQNDVAALLFTGGTTGLPKGVMLTHSNLIADVLLTINMTDRERYEENFGKAASLAILPLCHTFGFTVVIITLYAGAMMLMFRSFDPGKVLEYIERYKVGLFVGVPVMFQMLVNHPDFKSGKRDLSSLEGAASGSAALPPEISRKWEDRTSAKVGQGFGLTETSPITHTQPEWIPEIRAESIGIPIIDTDAKIVEPITLKELELGQVGELLIRGPQVMKGYWKKPEITEQTIVEGWLRTGDLARMDKDGYFYIEGRTKDIIKYKGYKVMPREVEEKLYEHPAVLEVGVVGVPDPNIGETIKAFIVLRKEFREKTTESEIIEWAKEKLAGYKYPRKIEFLTSLPRTPVGKIFRRKLREMEEKKSK
ncbi:MAG: AMP-binding protein [Candidatus Helarchaeota archaeon]|nr:AMP-binding protein [Candidatus Helarchaeota archaeon]